MSETVSRLDHWLLRLRWIPLAVIFAAAVQVIIWVSEREPPFHVLKATIIPPSEAGGSLRIDGDVHRDIDRNCSVTIIHWIADSAGFRHFLPPIGLTHESIKSAELANPGKTRYMARIEPTVAPGRATYHAENAYVCNPWHLVSPIVVVTEIVFEVTK